MASQDNSPSSPEQLPPSSPLPETTTLPGATAIDANGVEAPSDIESFHSGDEEFEAPQEEGKGASLSPVEVGVGTAGVDGDVGKAQDEVLSSGDGEGANLGGKALVAEGGGATEVAESEEVEFKDVGNFGEAGVANSGASGEVEVTVAVEKELPAAETAGGGNSVSAVEEKRDVSSSKEEVDDGLKPARVGGESSEVVGVEGVQGESADMDTEANEAPAPVTYGGSTGEGVEDPEKVESLVIEKRDVSGGDVEEVDDGSKLTNVGGESSEVVAVEGIQGESAAVDTKTNEAPAPVVDRGSNGDGVEDSEKMESSVVPEQVVPMASVAAEGMGIVAPGVDGAAQNPDTDSRDIGKSDGTIEEDDLNKKEGRISGESLEEKVEQLGSEALVNDGAVQNSDPDGHNISKSDGAIEEEDFDKEGGEGLALTRDSGAVDTAKGTIEEEDGAAMASMQDSAAISTRVEQERDTSEVATEARDRELVEVSDVVENGTMDAPLNAVQEENVVGGVGGGEEDDQGEAPTDEPAKVVILNSSEVVKQLLKDLEEGGSPAGSSGVGRSRDFSQEIDGQVAMDSDEEADTDEEGGGKELFDSAALAALLRAATGASSDGNITISAPDAARIFSVDRPAGLGSSMPALRPGPARAVRLTPPTSSDITVTGEAESNMDEEERALHEKVDQIRVKFLRLVQRLGHSAEDTVAAQVLYRLGLAEGIKRGRQTSRAFSIESAKRKALQLEDKGEEPLEFSCNILILGKTGVGKSSIINSILGEQVVPTNAFQPSTTYVKEIAGVVDGVKIRFLDTPGLRPSIMDQSFNKKVLASIKKHTKRCPPDIVLYVDRLDTRTRDFNDLPLLRSIASALGSSIWFNAIVALTHAASAPPDGPNGTPLGYEVFVAQRSHVVQHSIRQAAGDMRLMNPVALVENHLSCRRNREGQRVLPNGTAWKPQLLLLCYSSKTLSEANSLLKLQDPSPGKLFGFRMRSPPLPYLLSSLLQSRAYPKLSSDQGGENGDSDVDLGDLSDSDQEEEEDEYDQLPPFKPLRKAQIAMLSNEQKKAYFEEYDYRVKLLQKKQWKDELRRLKEMKKRGKAARDDQAAYGDMVDDYDQDGAPAAVPVPLPDMVLPPSFDCNNPAYRYRFLEPTSQLLARPVLDTHGWDHDCGYDGVSLEESLAVVGQFPASVAVQITKDKKEFNVHLDSSIAAKLGENASSLAGFDIQSVGKQLAYILRGETKIKNLKKNKTAAGVSVTFLGENVVTGLKLEDQIVIGRRVCLVGSTGAVRSQGDVAYGANVEARLREKDYPIGQEVTTLGLSLMKWRRDLALGANFQTQISTGRNSKMAVRVGLNNKLTGQFTVRTSTSDQLQIALLGVIPVALSIYRTLWPQSEAY